jgi:hypothetical protein
VNARLSRYGKLDGAVHRISPVLSANISSGAGAERIHRQPRRLGVLVRGRLKPPRPLGRRVTGQRTLSAPLAGSRGRAVGVVELRDKRPVVRHDQDVEAVVRLRCDLDRLRNLLEATCCP